MLDNLFTGLIVNTNGYEALIMSPSVTTALSPYIGYYNAGKISALMKQENIDVFSANASLKIIDDEHLRKILTPGNLLKLGFSIDDL
jgi:aspartate ammonia-lyase